MASFTEFYKRVSLKESAILYSQSIDKKNDSIKHKQQNEHETDKKIIDPIEISKSCVEHKISKNFELNDGTLILLTPEFAEKILYVNEELNEKNQKLFQSLLKNSIQTHEIAINFCNIYE